MTEFSGSKMLIVSYSLPNRASGTPVVIRKFLENFNKDEIVLIGRPVLKNEEVKGLKLKYRTYTIPTLPVGFRGERLWRTLSVFVGIFIGLYAIKKHKLNTILTFYRDQSSLLTGYLLFKLTGLPFYAYFCDLYLENYPHGIENILAKWLQPRVFKNAAIVFVLTEGIKEYYQKEYQLRTIVLPHCNNQKPEAKVDFSQQSDPVKIGYLGGINIDRIASLKILCEAVREDDNFEIIYFTPSPKSILEKEGLLITNSKMLFVPNDFELVKQLSKCDILFLPIKNNTNNSAREYQAITGFPTKTIEYLLSQKPILVHSDRDHFVSKIFDEFHCGLVTAGGSNEIKSLLLQINSDNSLRHELAKNSLIALEYFDGQNVSDEFRKSVAWI